MSIIIATFILIIFPLFINIKIYFDKELKKLFFSLSLFNIIKILSGYCKLEKNCIIIHFSNNKAKIYYFSNLIKFKDNVKIFMDYHFLRFNSVVNVSVSENYILYSVILFVVNYIDCNLAWFISHYKPYVKFINTINLYDNDSLFNVTLQATVVFNLLMIIISFVKIITGRTIYAIRKC